MTLEQDAVDLFEVDEPGAVADGFEQGGDAEIASATQQALAGADDQGRAPRTRPFRLRLTAFLWPTSASFSLVDDEPLSTQLTLRVGTVALQGLISEYSRTATGCR